MKKEKKETTGAITMKKLITVLAISILTGTYAYASDLGFNATMKLKAPIALTKVTDLVFPDTNLTGSAFTVVVAAGDAGAANFNATGGKNRTITKSVVEASINMTAVDAVGSIAVDTFTFGGPTAFSAAGVANGMRIGATAHILAATQDSDLYTGSATFRVVYN
jgi:hypothetical protein